ncbi:hypothetical protein Tco_0318397 [Tanacetum coccineum]
MEAAVQQYSVDKQCFKIHKKELFLNNDRLLHQIMSQDVMLTVMNSTGVFDNSVNLEMKKCGNPQEKLFTLVGNSCPLTRFTSTKVVVQIVLWYLDSECSKNMTGNRSQLINYVYKFLGIVRFNNDQIAKIMSYGDYQLGNVMISRVYYVESDDLGKLQLKAVIEIFIGYAPAKKAFWIYNKKTRMIIETIHEDFDELTAMASEQFSSGPRPQQMTLGTLSSGLVPNPPSSTPSAVAARKGTADLTVDKSPKTHTFHDDPLHETLHEDSTSQGSSSNVRSSHTPLELLCKWTMNHPLENVIGDPSRSVSTRKQLTTDAMWCYFDAFLTSVEPKNFKEAILESSWIDSM